MATLAAPIHGVERDALESEDVRQHRRRQRLSRALAAESGSRLDTDTPLAVRLALAAYGAAPTAEARGGLMRALDTGRHVSAYVRGGTDQISTRRAASVGSHGSVALTPDGGLLAYASDRDEAITLYDTRRRKVVGTLRTGSSPYFQALAIDPAGRLLAAYDDRDVVVFDLGTRAVRWSVPQPSLGSDLAFSADSRLLAGWDGESADAPRLRVWDVVAGRPQPVPALSGTPTGSLAFTWP